MGMVYCVDPGTRAKGQQGFGVIFVIGLYNLLKKVDLSLIWHVMTLCDTTRMYTTALMIRLCTRIPFVYYQLAGFCRWLYATWNMHTRRYHQINIHQSSQVWLEMYRTFVICSTDVLGQHRFRWSYWTKNISGFRSVGFTWKDEEICVGLFYPTF